MNSNKFEPSSASEFDDSTANTARTPPETIADDLDQETTSIPGPGFTFIIRSVSSGRVITLLDGRIVLNHPDGRGSIHWECMETEGWLGFRNCASGRFLGHDKFGDLYCLAERHRGWERFQIRQSRGGKYVLFMTHWEGVWPVITKMDKDVEMLARTDKGGSDGTLWEFVEVE